MVATTRIPDLTWDEYTRLTKVYPLLGLKEKLAVHRYAEHQSRGALAFRQTKQFTDPKAIR